ncbi:MAG: hypothetical protein H7138_07600 [Myxococcales bacterium]|nr:hypothetical protein [Myxococcales bacterium]
MLAAGDTAGATTIVLRELGPELFGFLTGVLGDVDADEVFSALSVRLWRSLSGFQGRCTLRTWVYVLARHELGRFRKGARRYADARVPISALEDVLAVARSTTRSTLATEKRVKLTSFRDELPVEDRTLLILRVDRNLAWDDIALAFADNPEAFSDEERKRESARLRKRFQLVKERLVARVRAAASPL